jgi:hypothetical protein
MFQHNAWKRFNRLAGGERNGVATPPVVYKPWFERAGGGKDSAAEEIADSTRRMAYT